MHTIATQIDIPATPEQVFAVLVDFPAHARWNPFFAKMEGEAVVGATLDIAARNKEGGEGMRFRPTVLEVEPGRRLRWKGKLFVPGLFDGTHDFRLEAIDGGTRVHHGEEFRGLLIPFVGGVLRETEEGFQALNKALAKEVAERLERSASAPG